MKIKIHTYPDGSESYTTGNIEILHNKQKPIKTEEIDMEEHSASKFLDNPGKYKLKKVKGKFQIREKKKNK